MIAFAPSLPSTGLVLCMHRYLELRAQWGKQAVAGGANVFLKKVCTGMESWNGDLERDTKGLIISTGLQGISDSIHGVLCSRLFFTSLHWGLCFLLTNKIFLLCFFNLLICSSHFFYSFHNPNVSLTIFFTIFLCLFFTKHIFCVTNVPLVRSFPFPPPSLSCLCNRLYIFPHVLNLSLLPLCQFLLSCVPLSHCSSSFLYALLLPAPSAFSCTQHALLPCRVHFAHTVVLPLHWIVLAHTCCFPVYPFHVPMRDLHIYSFGDASPNTRLLYLHSFLPILRLIFSHSQRITTVILSLCFFLSHRIF